MSIYDLLSISLWACAFRDSYEKFKKAGAEVVCISGDDTASHKNGTELFFRGQLIWEAIVNEVLSFGLSNAK
ncbi:Alkyl hydroperoxide reductase subunit C/ Thiol specific antioxidant [Corchorus olitorius]|uniref:Alkyl hydroperoxide reductase subunit C/ Thiol specific antioxidant n=1 Tax=Corchorus olitorius TaxID=93759 RepID=A0A1R3GAE5_9ROSI|nr:Alkyl hydroperoxide reductase subunit C/ Thiol specific antioxidant [Corchorus olitorius]